MGIMFVFLCVDLQCIVINGYVCACVPACVCVDALQIRPYVNGALYSILSLPSVRQEAREMVREEPAAGSVVASPPQHCFSRGAEQKSRGQTAGVQTQRVTAPCGGQWRHEHRSSAAAQTYRHTRTHACARTHTQTYRHIRTHTHRHIHT